MIYTNILEFKIQTAHQNATTIAIDLGAKKTGIAISNPELSMALPLCIIEHKSLDQLLQEIANLINLHKVEFIVLGFPEDQYNIKPYKHFADLLEQKFHKPIYLQDETYTTQMANQMLYAMNMKRKKHQKIDDHICAQLILQRFIQSHQCGPL